MEKDNEKKSYLDDWENMDWNNAEGFAEAGIKHHLENIGLEHLAERGAILDIGCGDGKLLAELAKIYPNARFFGLSSDVEAAKRNNPEAEIRNGQFSSLPFDNASMDLAISSRIFDYAEEAKIGLYFQTFKIRELASEIYRVLIPGGLYMPLELMIDDYFSQEDWSFFNEHFKCLSSISPGQVKILQKC